MKLSDFKDKHKRKECVILTCGPSLKEYSRKKIVDFCKNKIVICVKEAVFEYPDICDYFFSNATRHRDYNISNSKFVRIHQRYSGSPSNLDDYDILIDEDRPFSRKTRLLFKKNFSEYDFNNKIKRPWGPGILYESVFYFCKYLGCKNVYTIGWDLMDIRKTTKITHYFEDTYDNIYSKSRRWTTQNHIEEMKFVNENIRYLYDYFKNNGTKIIVVGKNSFVNKYIGRIYL